MNVIDCLTCIPDPFGIERKIRKEITNVTKKGFKKVTKFVRKNPKKSAVMGAIMITGPIGYVFAPVIASSFGSMGLLGVASTGTKIVSLHGAALNSAALASIVGGAAASGGGGMVGGTVAITAVVATAGGGSAYAGMEINEKNNQSNDSDPSSGPISRRVTALGENDGKVEYDDIIEHGVLIVSKPDHMMENAFYLSQRLCELGIPGMIIEWNQYDHFSSVNELPKQIIWLSGGYEQIDESRKYYDLTEEIDLSCVPEIDEYDEITIRMSENGNLSILADPEYWLRKPVLNLLIDVYMKEYYTSI